MSIIKSQILLDQFRNYLEQSEETQEKLPQKLSLLSFYNEIIALKNEVKIESRYVKEGLDSFQETAELVRASNVKIDQLLQEKNSENKHRKNEVIQRVAQGLIDLYDSQYASLQTLSESNFSKPWYQRWKRSDEKVVRTVVRSVREGQEMSLQRIIALLSECGVVPMEVFHRRFDPGTMRAVGTDCIPDLEEGVVSKESRRGFVADGTVVRIADVRVNKKNEKDTENR